MPSGVDECRPCDDDDDDGDVDDPSDETYTSTSAVCGRSPAWKRRAVYFPRPVLRPTDPHGPGARSERRRGSVRLSYARGEVSARYVGGTGPRGDGELS